MAEIYLGKYFKRHGGIDHRSEIRKLKHERDFYYLTIASKRIWFKNMMTLPESIKLHLNKTKRFESQYSDFLVPGTDKTYSQVILEFKVNLIRDATSFLRDKYLKNTSKKNSVTINKVIDFLNLSGFTFSVNSTTFARLHPNLVDELGLIYDSLEDINAKWALYIKTWWEKYHTPPKDNLSAFLKEFGLQKDEFNKKFAPGKYKEKYLLWLREIWDSDKPPTKDMLDNFNLS